MFQFELIDARYYLQLPAASLHVPPCPLSARLSANLVAGLTCHYTEFMLLQAVSVSERGYGCMRLGHQKVIAGI